ncbi:MAG: 16S rRNA (guanine(966)-N(2))-methyltransferase RsmD [Hyphomicrobium sp.]
MRVVGGKFRGRALAAPSGEAIRPTSDRVREAVFNILTHGLGVDFAGLRVVDMFAGSGALGIEALSRGAEYCLLVEEHPDARALIRRNIEALGLTGVTRIFRRDATDLGPAGTMAPFGLAFLDPPYGKGLGERGLCSLRDGGWLVPDATVVMEERADAAVTLPAGFTERDRRTWGDTQVVFGVLG